MKRASLSVLQTCLVFFLISTGMQCFAQIQITDSDLLALRGNTFMVQADDRESIPVNVGMPGTNQTYDFTNQTIPNPFNVNISYLDPQTTPYDTAFPTANFTTLFSDPSVSGFASYEYANISPTAWTDLGEVQVTPPPQDTVIIEKQVALAVPLPVSFNSSWTSVRSDTFGDISTFAIITNDSIISLVDGWGTIMTSMGNFDCLRLKELDFCTSITVINGVPTSTETETFINYIWINKDRLTIASVESQDGETDPNFTDASGFTIIGQTTGIENLTNEDNLAEGFQLQQNYPNPFNPSTTIRFALRNSEAVELSIYNQLGQKVETLINEQMAAGSYSLQWNAEALPSGVYYYRLQAGAQQQMRKAVLMK
ncbi:MAG: T9SS type A sorting domain-containing protein [Calditrichia bacterium]